MLDKPTVWNRMCAALQGEVSADTLEAYRRASLAVYDALEHAESHRKSAKEAGNNAWTLPTSTKAEIVCTWNAFVLQTLGDRFLEADYEGDPSTRGFVPPITGDQILRFYTQVEGWLNRAQQAHFNPDYKLDVYVPAELPAWSEVEPCPNAHLVGMLEAMKAVRDHTDAAILFLDSSPPQGDEQKKQLNAIRQVHANAQTKARYAEDMMGGSPSPDVHERVEEHVKDAIESYYLLGQLLAMPELAQQVLAPKPQPIPAPPAAPPLAPPMGGFPAYTPSPALSSPAFGAPTGASASGASTWGAPARLPLPNEAGFDMWCLSDVDAREKLGSDSEARRALKSLWQLDPDPRRTLDIQAEINEAFARGDIAFASDRWGKKLGHFFCAPWGSVYQVRRPLTLGGRRLRTMEQFVFNVTCEGVNLGVPFERDIMTGNFNPTTKFEYGDPNEEPDH